MTAQSGPDSGGVAVPPGSRQNQRAYPVTERAQAPQRGGKEPEDQ